MAISKEIYEKNIALVFKHLSRLINMGVPLAKALDAVAAEAGYPVSKVIEYIAKRLRTGRSLKSSLEQISGFPAELLERVQHAEIRGNLDAELDIIAEDIEVGVYSVDLPETLDELLGDIDSEQMKINDLLQKLIFEAVNLKASDLHLEPESAGGRIRLRIDGVLKSQPRKLDEQTFKALMARFKMLSALDVSETRKPQDGRILINLNSSISDETQKNDHGDQKRIEMRVSFCPFTRGEKLVARFLCKSHFPESLDAIRLSQDKQEILKNWISKPYGIVLVSGPTGSGKTTTLYLMLQELGKNSNCNTMTIEEPVEILLPNVYQMQINPAIGLTWVAGLKSLMRQDPDVIGIGEIQSADVAELAVQIAQTGHLVLSQLHSSSAIATIKLMADMGVPVHMLQETIIGVVSQRLVRRLCPNCKQEINKSNHPDLPESLKISNSPIFEAKGCDACNQTGYRGRDVIMELLSPQKEFWHGLTEGYSEKELQNLLPQSWQNMKNDGYKRVLAGETSLSEVMRILNR